MTTSPIPNPIPPSLPSKKKEPTNKARLALEKAMKSLESHSFKQRKPEDHQGLYNSIISLCISNKALNDANRLRSHLACTGHQPSLFLNNQFINLYSKCREPDTARNLFNSMHEKNLVSWNAMIAGYCSNARFIDSLGLFQTLMEFGPEPDHITYLTTLRASAGSRDLQRGKQMHAQLVKNGLLASRIEVGNALINMYTKLGRLEEAKSVGGAMAQRDEVTWNSLIAAYGKNGCGDQALALFVEMMEVGLDPDEFTFGSLLGLKDMMTFIEELHSQIIKRGLVSNIVTGSALLDAYARCQKPKDALLVFSSMPERNAITWNSAIAACFANDMTSKGLQIYLQMAESALLPDEYTISSLLKVAATQLSVSTGKQLHGLAVKIGQHTDTTVGNSLINMYAKHESVSDCWQAFQSVPEKDLISWNSMAQAYLQNEEFEKALVLFKEMKMSGFEPDEFSFVGALAACASLGLLRTGSEIHCDMIKSGLKLDAFMGSALIDMYSKSMAITKARKVFDNVHVKDLITWNSMISGLAQNGYLEDALNHLCLMREEEGLEPDGFTFASALSVCANATAMQQGKQVHAVILKSPELEVDTVVTNALITMYSRSGSIKEAEQVFSETNNKNVVTWTSMIAGYAQSGCFKEALKLFEEMERSGVRPNDKTFIALLTACSHGGMSNEASKYFKMMEMKYGITPGFDHYACMVDILGRTGRLNEAEEFIDGMPYEPDALVWKMLLSSCRIHGDRVRGKRSMERILALEPGDSAAYVLLSNLYADLGDWAGVAEIRQLMKENGVKKEPGKSWIEIRNRLHEFMAGDNLHPKTDEIYVKVKDLLKHMKDEGYAPGCGTVR